MHRDLKPSNVMVTAGGPRQGARLRRRPAAREPLGTPDDETRTSELRDGLAGFVGTLPYAAPEQATGREVDGRADIFSLGVMLYELAQRRAAVHRRNAAQMLEAILRDDVPPFSRAERDPGLPQLERLVRRMLARDPDRRVAERRRRARRARRDPIGRCHGRCLDRRQRPVSSIARRRLREHLRQPRRRLARHRHHRDARRPTSAQLEGVSVIPRERVSQRLKTLGEETGERGEPLFLRAGRELGARWLVTGGFQRSGDAVRVTASLTDVASGQLVGTTKVDGRLARDLRSAGSARARAGSDRCAPPSQPETNDAPGNRASSRRTKRSRAACSTAAPKRSSRSIARCGCSSVRSRSIPSYARAHVELGAAYGTKADYLSLPELRSSRHRHAAARDRAASRVRPRLARAGRPAGRDGPGYRRHGRDPPRARDRSGGRRARAARWAARSSSARRDSPKPPTGSAARSNATRAPAGTPCSSRIARRCSATSRAASAPRTGGGAAGSVSVGTRRAVHRRRLHARGSSCGAARAPRRGGRLFHSASSISSATPIIRSRTASLSS